MSNNHNEKQPNQDMAQVILRFTELNVAQHDLLSTASLRLGKKVYEQPSGATDNHTPIVEEAPEQVITTNQVGQSVEQAVSDSTLNEQEVRLRYWDLLGQ